MPRRTEGVGGPRRAGGNTSHVSLAIAVVFILHLVTYSATSQLRTNGGGRGDSTTLMTSLSRRSSLLLLSLPILPISPLSYTPPNLSHSPPHAREEEETMTRDVHLSSHSHSSNESTPSHPRTEQSGALVDYKHIYETSSPRTQPFVLFVMMIWLSFLFAFVGITASDFFCPNLSTIASRLGMSESVVSEFPVFLESQKSMKLMWERGLV